MQVLLISSATTRTRSATILSTRCTAAPPFTRLQGAFTHHNKTVIMTTMSRGQALKLRNYIRQVEPHAFMLISNSSEIVGKGFLAS